MLGQIEKKLTASCCSDHANLITATVCALPMLCIKNLDNSNAGLRNARKKRVKISAEHTPIIQFNTAALTNRRSHNPHIISLCYFVLLILLPAVLWV